MVFLLFLHGNLSYGYSLASPYHRCISKQRLITFQLKDLKHMFPKRHKIFFKYPSYLELCCKPWKFWSSLFMAQARFNIFTFWPWSTIHPICQKYKLRTLIQFQKCNPCSLLETIWYLSHISISPWIMSLIFITLQKLVNLVSCCSKSVHIIYPKKHFFFLL